MMIICVFLNRDASAAFLLSGMFCQTHDVWLCMPCHHQSIHPPPPHPLHYQWIDVLSSTCNSLDFSVSQVNFHYQWIDVLQSTGIFFILGLATANHRYYVAETIA